MAIERTTVFGTGTIYWPKIVGERALHSNYDGDGRQWAYELAPDDPSFLKEHGLLDRLKDKEDPKNPDKGEFLYMKKPEFTKDGDKNEPIRIYDEDNNPWPEDKLIGNGTKVDYKLSIVNYGKGKKSGIYTQALRVTELVPYEGNDFAAFDSDRPTKPAASKKAKPSGKAAAVELDDLDDDIPPFDKD